MPTEVDNVAKEPVEDEAVKHSGTLTEWSAVSGEWIPSTHGNNGGIWECPALVELPVDGDPTKTKWVLQVSINDGAPAGGSGMQYFVGDFDGKTFENENSSDQVLWTDYGADFYAAVEWSGIEGESGEKYWLGWMSNWQYANNTPTSSWRSSTTLPRKMELTQTEDGLRLKQTPVSINSIRDNSNKVSYENKVVSTNNNLLDDFSGDTFEMIAEFDVSKTSATEFGFEVRKGSNDEYTKIGYQVANKQLFVDRTNSDLFDYGNNVVEMHEAPLSVSDGTVKMHIFVDRSAVEVFGNNGETVITDQIFPSPTSKDVKIYSKDGNSTLKSLTIYPVKSIWKKSDFKSKLNGWTSVNGNWADTIDGKQGQSSGDAFNLSDEAGSDFKYEADIKVLDTDSHPNDPNKDTVHNLVGAGGLVFRSDSKGKNSYVVNVDVKNNAVKLIKFVNGVGHDLVSYNNDGKLNLHANKNYHLEVVTADENIKAYLDDELVIDTSDQTYIKGQFGLNVWDSTVVFNQVKNKVNKVKK
ncbi:glycoside hydrolase family 32 protein [Metabacillus herbersteinensis]|uniref:Glycoside hydrolase family 32 protein n=1 Tax=Metabacillus herbersteinensis TaxID=283816 RepID=A0ABV6GLZ7_9BACI